MPNPGVVLERVGSTAERLRQLPYEKRVCKTEAYPAVSRPDRRLRHAVSYGCGNGPTHLLAAWSASRRRCANLRAVV